MSGNEPIEFDFNKLQSEINALPQDKIKEQLLKMRVRQKVQQKKQQAKGAQKAYQKLQNEKRKMLMQKAAELGILDAINEEAERQAEEKFNSLLEDETPDTPEVEPTNA